MNTVYTFIHYFTMNIKIAATLEATANYSIFLVLKL